MRKAPTIDGRSGEQFYQELAADLRRHLHVDASEDPLARGLLRVFARYCELLAQRLNRVPEKNRLAFLDTLNLSRIPPLPARAPLTFIPVKKLPALGAPLVVKAYSSVAATPGEGETEPVVFETVCDLALTNLELKKVLALDPQTDRCADKSALAGTDARGEGAFAFDAARPLLHALYLGHSPIFGRPGIARLSLRFEIDAGKPVESSAQAVEWFVPTPDGEMLLKPVGDETHGLARSGEVVFESLPEWPAVPRYGHEAQWLACRLTSSLAKSTGELRGAVRCTPGIRSLSVSASWKVGESKVESAFFNNIAVDLSREFFPFGERPRFRDVFCLSCPSFSIPGADVTVTIKLANPASGGEPLPLPPVYKAGSSRIQWESWDGREWVKLDCRDATDGLTEDGDVSFQLASPVPKSAIYGTEGFWVRARLISGHYGEEGYFEFNHLEPTPRRIPSTLSPPCIRSIAVSSSFDAGPERPERVIAENNLSYDEIDPGLPFEPFRRSEDPHKGLFLGFKASDDARKMLTSRPIDLYFHVDGAAGRTFVRGGATRPSPKLAWQYWNGANWSAATVLRDGTHSLTGSGLVTVSAGADIAPWKTFWLDSDPGAKSEEEPSSALHWLRALWTSGEFDCPPRLCRILLNTVPATQSLTLHNELLGSSNARPSQVFRTARVPVLRDLVLEVREPVMPSGEELAQIREEEGDDAVSLVPNARGTIEQIWIRWHEVSDWLASGHGDRHYVVDRQSGSVQFGDGVRGLIPPAGANNIRLSRYQTGGGSSGNKPAGSITQLRSTIVGVDSVTNLEPATGGQDMESWASVQERGARSLRHRNRAVTVEDYEDLARLASRGVARVKCYPNLDLLEDPSGTAKRTGVVSLILLPQSADAAPQPDFVLLRQVRDFLDERRMQEVELILLGPDYVRVCIEAAVAPVGPQTTVSLLVQCEQELARYLHPLTGGADGRGWGFGELPYESAVYNLLESIQGLEYVRSLSIRLEEERPGLLKSGIFMICSGDHKVSLGL